MGQSDYGVFGLYCTSSHWKKVKWTMDVLESVSCGSNDAVHLSTPIWWFMMKSSNGTILCITGHLCGEFTGPRWIPHTKASDAELWCFFLICIWINGCVNNRDAGDLRRHRTHHDIIVMLYQNTETWTRWMLFYQYHSLMHFHQTTVLYFDSNFT